MDRRSIKGIIFLIYFIIFNICFRFIYYRLGYEKIFKIKLLKRSNLR